MNRSTLRRLVQADLEKLLEALATRQYLAPHEPLDRALARTVETLGVCPQAAARAVEWLGLNGTTAIGRLRRTELMQLARSLHRFWRGRESAPQPSERHP